MQQYTCPKCLQDYTDLTASLHAGCGTVEPQIESKPVSENADIALFATGKDLKTLIESLVLDDKENELHMHKLGEEFLAIASKVYDDEKTIPIQPKKRGRPAKAK